MARFKILDETGNVVNTIIADPGQIDALYPEGNYELVPEPPAPVPTPTGDDVNAERDRRIAIGHMFTISGYGDIPLQGRIQDQINLQARQSAALRAKAAGVADPVLILRDAENVNHMLTPDQMIDLVDQGISWIEATMMVSWAMKDGTVPFEGGIPADFAADVYWP